MEGGVESRRLTWDPGRERIARGWAAPAMVRGRCLARAWVSAWRRLCDGFALVWAGGPVTHGVG